jgi:hypothetical protein
MSQHEPGEKYSAKIVKSAVREIGQKDAVEIRAELPSGEIVGTLIFLTRAAADMARGQLKACGFDVDTQSLATLMVEEKLLEGNFIDLESEDYKGKIQWRIRTAKPVPESRLFDHDAMLRAAKNRDAMATGPLGGEPPPIADDDIPF